MANAKILTDGEVRTAELSGTAPPDIDPVETAEWLESLEYILESRGPERAAFLIQTLRNRAQQEGVELPPSTVTPYINTIPADKQPAYAGKSRDRTPHQEHHSVERDGDGGASEQELRGNWRAYLDVRLRRHALRSRPLITSSAGVARMDTAVIRFTFKGMRRPASMLEPSWKDG